MTAGYAHYYLIISVLATLLFGCAVFDFGPLGHMSPVEATGVVVISFTFLTVVLTLFGR